MSIDLSIADIRKIEKASRDNISKLKTSKGYLLAGIPYFKALYGRDSIISALELLPFDPLIARDTLYAQAPLQGSKVDFLTEEEPGKIPHEYWTEGFDHLAKNGWYKSNGRLIYYGSVDATPLFIILMGEYLDFTNDWETFKALWPFIEKAYYWICEFGDKDKDGFVEYESFSSTHGLDNQGWKDSWDSIKHKDGALAEPPIALVEVQAYVYQALKYVAGFYRKIGDEKKAELILQDAEKLKRKFNERFWMPEEKFYALALDKDKKKVEVISSNVGHLPVTGIVPEERAGMVIDRLLKPDIFINGKLRTLSSQEIYYDPRSYHNGSIWPHDNWFFFKGLIKYKRFKEALQICNSFLRTFIELDCIPELLNIENGKAEFCYRTCKIQAWAAGACSSFIHFLNKYNNSIRTNT